jgi:hypothetical protein
MPTKQTRRSISVRGATYDQLRSFCDAHGRSMSDLVEEQLAALFARDTTPKAPEPLAATQQKSVRLAAIANKVARAPIPAPPPRPPAPTPPAATVKPEGRPAPAPAAIPTRIDAPEGDYRVIRF